eukprot:GHVO01064518.1.p1 GENE.GHVO01064518.1~~GHVO01064518.1.p1  ORF type:complete len:116 (+),score=19.87 GHVO01064518.1:301-648(+)
MVKQKGANMNELTEEQLKYIDDEGYTNLSDTDLLKIAWYLSDIDGDMDNALSNYEEVMFYQNMDLSDVAREFVEEGFFGDVSKSLENYIDFEKLGDDLNYDGYTEEKEGVFFYGN